MKTLLGDKTVAHTSSQRAAGSQPPASSLQPPSRHDLETQPLQSLHAARNWSKAQVSLLEWPPGSGQQVVVKDLRRCPLWFRLLAGRRFLRREWRVLRRLSDLDFVPRALAYVDRDAIVMEQARGRSVRVLQTGEISEEVLSRVESALKQVHARGIFHGDLHGDNILIDDDGVIAFIDWATATDFGPAPRGVRGRLFEEGRNLDLRALAKLKAWHGPRQVTAQEREMLLSGGSGLYRRVKKLRRVLDRLRGRGPQEQEKQAHLRRLLDGATHEPTDSS